MSTKLQFLAMMTFIVAGIFTCTVAPKASNEMEVRPNVLVSITECTTEDLLQEEIDDAYLLDEQSPTQRDIMVQEIIQVWTMFFDDEAASINDPRRNTFEEYAEYLADAITMYENQPTDIGGQLPKDGQDTHLLLATMITKESSVTSDVIGKMGEVGLLQIHGQALAGYNAEVVRNNPKLGVLLGVRWFAYQTSACKPHRIATDDEAWRLEDWLGPLSAYAGGPNAINRKTGGCYTFQLAVNRVNLTKLYRSRINGSRS